MKIYHGSEELVKKPDFNLGKPNNDFGKGFYCTDEIEKAKEWACKHNKAGKVNEYEIDLSKLKVLDLTNEKYNVLNWISILIKNRTFNIENPVSKQAKEFLLKNYYIDCKGYDVIIGYRADDSYFSYAQGFIDNSLSIESLKKAMELGNLGKQIVLVSEKAYKDIKYINCYEVDNSIYYKRFISNDVNARSEYKKILSNEKETYIFDILRKDNNK